MSERMTAISLPGFRRGMGFAEYGRVPVPNMIELIRKRALYAKAWADAVLSADDGDFHVETYVGPYAKRDRQILQQGKERPQP